MDTPAKPTDEASRIGALHALNILDTLPEERFDRLTRLSKRLFGVPIALVSLIDTDRQWFKSSVGLDATETPRDISFCGHAILGNGTFVVPDASTDERFQDNPLVIAAPHIRFYAGCPLTVGNGGKVGTLCVIDWKPREFSAEDMALLRDLARMVEQELEAVQLATMDELTNLSNRRGFEALARHALDLCRRLQKSASLLYFDLDLFKQINDRFGHAEGDRALVSFAQLLSQTFRDSDVVARLGGDEFAVLAIDVGKQDLEIALGRLQFKLDRHNREAGIKYELNYSVGVLSFDPRRHADIAEVISEADRLMYEQKFRHQQAHGSIANLMPPVNAANRKRQNLFAPA